ncbi:hypothetical protein [Rhizobium sp. L18]|uniref:hypothetical protein n=1 Tax=Rhizobium sp. L18 TaxID=2035451 RepID=UPI000BEAAA93|nr:hypothetical protein [Rhizobium sp. L18]PDS87297.1 hypothetical protein CO654_02140 [Rhizobium sp. L18]
MEANFRFSVPSLELTDYSSIIIDGKSIPFFIAGFLEIYLDKNAAFEIFNGDKKIYIKCGNGNFKKSDDGVVLNFKKPVLADLLRLFASLQFGEKYDASHIDLEFSSRELDSTLVFTIKYSKDLYELKKLNPKDFLEKFLEK